MFFSKGPSGSEYAPVSQNFGSDYCCSGVAQKNAAHFLLFFRWASFSPLARCNPVAAQIMPQEPGSKFAGSFINVVCKGASIR
jgi:hypothetical protein